MQYAVLCQVQLVIVKGGSGLAEVIVEIHRVGRGGGAGVGKVILGRGIALRNGREEDLQVIVRDVVLRVAAAEDVKLNVYRRDVAHQEPFGSHHGRVKVVVPITCRGVVVRDEQGVARRSGAVLEQRRPYRPMVEAGAVVQLPGAVGGLGEIGGVGQADRQHLRGERAGYPD